MSHLLFEQAGNPFVLLQILPHAPQLAVSSTVCFSQPFASLPSQFAQPLWQLVTTHTPCEQVEAAFARLQTLKQNPQLFGSVWRWTSQSILSLLQSASVGGSHQLRMQ